MELNKCKLRELGKAELPLWGKMPATERVDESPGRAVFGFRVKNYVHYPPGLFINRNICNLTF